MNLLKIRISDCSKEIQEKYIRQSLERDASDAGFDLFMPDNHVVRKVTTSHQINHHVQIEFSKDGRPSHVLMIPRSSMSKTTLRLANSIGLIDSGYRGDLKAFVDNLGGDKAIEVGTSLFQLIVGENCEVQIVKELTKTQRGSGGFGSTGNTI